LNQSTRTPPTSDSLSLSCHSSCTNTEEMSRAIGDLRPTAALLGARAGARAQLGDLEGAIADGTSALALDPAHFGSRMNRAACFLHRRAERLRLFVGFLERSAKLLDRRQCAAEDAADEGATGAEGATELGAGLRRLRHALRERGKLRQRAIANGVGELSHLIRRLRELARDLADGALEILELARE
jgi:hypothetical protein